MPYIHNATLVIAKLDRLARNVAFIAQLIESGVEFVAVDMPTANRLAVHILAAMAEHEREMISARTKAALVCTTGNGADLAVGLVSVGLSGDRLRYSPVARYPQRSVAMTL